MADTSRATMKDIAERVGISVKSVSRVLNGEGGVSARTSERVMATAAELGFRRNDLARSLRQGDRTGTIGLAVPATDTVFHDRLIRGVEEVAAGHGALVLTACSRSGDRERTTLLALSSRRVDGLLVVPSGDDHSYLKAEQAAGTPLVFVDRPARGLEVDAVLGDDIGGARLATRHLLDHGHRRIAVIGADHDLHTVAERVKGHRAALAAAGLPADPELIRLGAATSAEARTACAEALNRGDRPTAVLALNNRCAVGAALALRDAGEQRRTALVGYDDFETAELFTPPLTVVSHDITEMGRAAARRLFTRVAGDRPETCTAVLDATLTPRGSGELSA